MISPTRRRFLQTAALATCAVGSSRAAEEAQRFPILGFTKPFQDIGFERTAEVAAEVGWNGIECPVRANGQVKPERVEEDLPKLAAALAARGLKIGVIATDVLAPGPLTERVLRTALQLGITRYRLAFAKYDLKQPIPPQLAALKPQLRELAALNKQLGMKGGMQNHSGDNYVGAPVWDIYELVHDIDPERLGICFDIGHATLEGGLSWPVQARLMEPFFTCIYVKDFAWEKGSKGWAPKWGPLGEGMVRRDFFEWLKKSSYRGPISQHCEYLEGAKPENVAALKADAALLKSWL